MTLTTRRKKIKCPRVVLEPGTAKTSTTANALTTSAIGEQCDIVAPNRNRMVIPN